MHTIHDENYFYWDILIFDISGRYWNFGYRVSSGKDSIFPWNHKLVMGRVLKKLGSGGFGYTQILESRVRVYRVLKKVGFERVISGSGIPGLITNVKYKVLRGPQAELSH